MLFNGEGWLFVERSGPHVFILFIALFVLFLPGRLCVLNPNGFGLETVVMEVLIYTVLTQQELFHIVTVLQLAVGQVCGVPSTANGNQCSKWK